MTFVNALAVDSGLATFGACLVQTNGHEHDCFRVAAFESKPRFADFDIRSCDDRVRRARALDAWLHDFTRGVDIDIVFAEAMSFPRGTAPIVCMSLAWGVLAAWLNTRDAPLLAATPSYWRSSLIGRPPKGRGSRNAALVEQRERKAHARAVSIVPSFTPLARLVKPELQVHTLDAIGVFAWGLTTPELRRLVA